VALPAVPGFFSVDQHCDAILEHNGNTIAVANPGSGAVFAGGQGFVLEASGYDEEDGSLGFGAFSWRSDLEGNLGAGRHIVLSAGDLTPGTHMITVTGTDSSQMTATATIHGERGVDMIIGAASEDTVVYQP